MDGEGVAAFPMHHFYTRVLVKIYVILAILHVPIPSCRTHRFRSCTYNTMKFIKAMVKRRRIMDYKDVCLLEV